MFIDLQQAQRTQVGGIVSYSLERGQYHHKRTLDAVISIEADLARTAMLTHLHQIKEDIRQAAEIDTSLRSDA